MPRQALLILLFGVWSSPSAAQEKFTDNVSLSAFYHYGYVLPEYSNFIYLVEEPVQSFSLLAKKKTIGENDWEKLYHYPEYGFLFLYSTLGNDRVHGREIALMPFFQLDILKGRRLAFYNLTALGLGYVTRKFDMEDNYLNIAVGSHFNLHFNLRFGINYRFDDRVKVNAGLAFDHFSNANSKNPNLGINYVTSFAGVSYRIGKESALIVSDLSPFQRSGNFEFIYSFGAKRSRGVLDPKLYYTSSMTFEYKFKAFRALHFGAGADLFYDNSTEAEMRAVNNNDFRDQYDYRTGVHFSQELVYNRLSIILQEGFYLILTDEVNGKAMYNRGVVRYRFTDKFFLQIAMKSHLHILDFPELGAGVRW